MQYLSIAEAAWGAVQSGNASWLLPVPPKDRGRKWLSVVEVAERRSGKRIGNGVLSAASTMCADGGSPPPPADRETNTPIFL